MLEIIKKEIYVVELKKNIYLFFQKKDEVNWICVSFELLIFESSSLHNHFLSKSLQISPNHSKSLSMVLQFFSLVLFI